jgi:hypothetical protein
MDRIAHKEHLPEDGHTTTVAETSRKFTIGQCFDKNLDKRSCAIAMVFLSAGGKDPRPRLAFPPRRQ